MASSRLRLKVFISYALLTIMIAIWLLPKIPHPEYQLPFAIAVFLSLVVPLVFVFNRRPNLMEPIYWFAFMYLILVPDAYYFIFTNFETSAHLLIDTIDARSRWLTTSLTYSVIGFVATAIGYFLVRHTSTPAPICYEPSNQLPDSLIYFVIAVSLVIAGLNFIYVASQYPGGIIEYLLQSGFKTRRLELIEGSVTTVGFNFAYSAVLTWIFVLVRRSRIMFSERIIFGLALLGSLLIIGSQARVFQTISYLLIVASLFYMTSESVNRTRNYFLGVSALLCMGILLYMLRVVSILLLNHPDSMIGLDYVEVVLAGGESLLHLIFGRGNVPNLPALMNILALWDLDDMQYGRTLLSWTQGLSELSPFLPVAKMTRDWYSTVGGVPPTVLGEMYVNFHFMGGVVAMFLIGVMMAVCYNTYLKTRSFWVMLTFVVVVLRFFFIWPKGESANLMGTLWLILPVWVTVLTLKGMMALVRPALRTIDQDGAALSGTSVYGISSESKYR